MRKKSAACILEENAIRDAKEIARLRAAASYGKGDATRVRRAFERKAEHHLGLMNYADALGAVKLSRAHCAVADGYYRAARILGGPPPNARMKP